MPDVNYVITIKSEVGEESSSPSRIAPSSSGGGGSDESSSFASFGKKVSKLAPAAFALKMADLQITTHFNRVSLRTGNSLLQEKMQYKYEATKSLAMSAITGFAVGGVVGAAVGVFTNVVNRVVNNEIQEENLRIASSVESIGIDQAMIRAGAYGNRRS